MEIGIYRIKKEWSSKYKLGDLVVYRNDKESTGSGRFIYKTYHLKTNKIIRFDDSTVQTYLDKV